MVVYLIQTVFGLFLLDDNGETKARVIYYPDVERAANEIRSINEDTATQGLKDMISKIENISFDSIHVMNTAMGRLLGDMTTYDVSAEETSPVIKLFIGTQDTHLQKEGIVESKEEAQIFRRDVGIMVSRSMISEASEERDLLVKHAIDSVGEIDKSINLVAMRLREWYSLHFPSLNNIIEDHMVFAKIVATFSSRIDIKPEELVSLGVPEGLAERVAVAAKGDIGAPLESEDHVMLKKLADEILAMYSTRRELEEYVATIMRKIAPNLTELAGPLVGARLLSQAGSLKELARKPSSTLQIFGAEKALFRSLKTGADPPKHGLIYQVSEIHSAPYWQRGKIARALAGKLAIAARVDAYSDRDIGATLRQQFLDRLKEIQTQYPEAPPPKPKKSASKERGKPKKRRDRSRPRKKGGRKK